MTLPPIIRFVFVFILAGFSLQGFAQDNNPQGSGSSELILPTHFKVTRPLREIFAENPVDESVPHVKGEMPDKKNRKPQLFPLAKEGDPVYGADPSVMQREGGSVPAEPMRLSQDGQLPGGGFRPYDPTGAVGPNHYIQIINSTTFRVYNKTGGTLLTGTLGNLWSPATGNNGDPIVLYDRVSDRWFMSQFGNSSNRHIYIAISQTNDPLGSWYTYTYTHPQFPDYLKFGIWHDAIYMTANTGTQRVFAFNRSEMYAGSPTARAVSNTFSPPEPSGFFLPLPADASDNTSYPPSSRPCPIVSYSDNGWGAGFSDAVNIFHASVNWPSPTPVMTIASAATVATAAFNANYDPGWNDVSQPGTAQKLDGIGGVLMYRLQWRSWGGYNTLVMNWGVEISSTQRGIYWCEVRQDQTTNAFSMYQQGSFSPGSDTRWMGSLAMNDAGAIGLAYMRSNSTTMFPSIYYSGRRSCDPLGTLPVTETLLATGTGSQTTTNRVGDYAQLNIDPSDGTTFWGTCEYFGGATGGGAARTRIYSFTIAPCGVASVSISQTAGINPSCEGSLVTFTATPTNGGATPSYQWQVNGVNAGFNSPTFNTSTIANGDVVTCIMTSSISGIGGSPATSNAIGISRIANPSFNVSGSNYLCNGTTTPFSALGNFSKSLITTLTGTNGFNGNVFDVTALNTITITDIKMNVFPAATQAEVWYKAGGYGNASVTSSTGWTKLGATVPIVSAGTTQLTRIPITATLTIPAGQTYGLVVVANGSNRYSDGTAVGNVFASNADLQIKEGHGGSGFGGTFSFTNSPRVFNGEIVYTTAEADTWSWTPATGLSSTSIANPNASPTSSTTYTVTGTTSLGCSATDSHPLAVIPSPVNGTVSASSSELCLGSSTNFQYTPPSGSSCGGASASGFTGTYLLSNFTQIHTNSNGTFSVNAGNDTLTMVSSNNGSFSAGTSTLRIIAPCDGVVSFGYQYTTVDGPFYDRPQFWLNSNLPTLFTGYSISGSTTQSGTVEFLVLAGDTINIGTNSTDNVGGSCTVRLFNFTAPISSSISQIAYWYNQPSAGSLVAVGNNTGFIGSQTGTQTYYAQVVDLNNGCSQSNRIPLTIYVNDLPDISGFGATPSTICLGDSSQFSLTGSSLEIDSLLTTLTTNNGNQGVAFDVTAINTLTINGVKMNISNGTQAQVWYKVGGYGGTNITSNTGWVQIGTTAAITPAGSGNLTNIPLTSSVTIPAGQTYGLLVITNGATNYLNGTSVGNVFASNPDMQIKEGHGGSGFGGTFAFFNFPRVFSGQLQYEVNNGINGVNWTPATGLNNPLIASPKASPTLSTTYTATITDANGCTRSSSLNLYVRPAPALGTATATPGTICLNSPLSLSYAAVGGLQCNGAYQNNFTGYYAPANWAISSLNSNGSIVTTSAPDSIQFISSNNSSSTNGTNNFSILIPCTGIVSFNWQYSTTDGPIYDRPRYSLDGTNFFNFPGYNTSGANTQSGTANIQVTGGQTLTLQAYSLDNVAGPCTFWVKNFSAPIQTINAQTVSWFNAPTGGSLLGTSNPQTYTPLTTGNQTYYAQVTNAVTGCSNSTRVATNVVTVNPRPTVTFTGSTTICSGNSVAITANGASSYIWQPGALAGATINVSPATTTTYTVTATGTNGCTTTATRTITVNITPIVGTTVTNATICSGQSTSITGTGATTYVWQPGGLSGTTVNVSPASTTTYTVTGTAANGCTATATRLITVNTTPTVGTSVTNATICSGQSTLITGTGASTYTWQPGGLSGTLVTVSPASTTTYTVTGTAANGCTATATRLITVNTTPTVGTTVTNATICSGQSTSITGTGATTYIWNPGGLVGTTVNVSPASTTTYTVTGTAANGCTATAIRLITVNTTPTVSTTVTNATICTGQTTSITGTGASTYTWQPGGLSGTTVNVSPASTTTYTVTGTAANGCTATATRTITVNTTPTVGTTVTNATICAGGSTSISATGASTYIWNPGGLTGTTVNVSPASTTTYTVIGTAANGCTATATRTITVNTPPTVTTSATSTTIVCGASTTLSASGASTYTWQPGGLSGSSVVVSPTTTTTYTVTGTAANGCTATATRTITVTGSCGTTLSIKLYIQGYYVGAGLMTPVMLNQGVPGATATQCDTITVELRNTSAPYSLVATQKRILNTNGNSTGFFSNTGNYYVVIKHRNGLQTWSANPVNLTGGAVSYDFSNLASKAFGSNQINLAPGVFGIYSGEINADENIDLSDLGIIETDIINFASGYFASDINGDGNVDIVDAPIVETNVLDFIFSIHP